jgi:hypothetical protein
VLNARTVVLLLLLLLLLPLLLDKRDVDNDVVSHLAKMLMTTSLCTQVLKSMKVSCCCQHPGFTSAHMHMTTATTWSFNSARAHALPTSAAR